MTSEQQTSFARPPNEWPEDVRRLIHQRFPREEIVTVYQTLAPLGEASDVLLRAVLLLADGSLAQLRHYTEVGAQSAGEVIHWAEYDDTTGNADMRTRDLSRPIGDAELTL